MTEQLRFDGRTVAITGAGRGIGKEHALLFASRGAQVVVNDAAVAMDGQSIESGNFAEQVAEEIRTAGGTAIANHGDVTKPGDAATIVEQALDTFGGLDAIVNNAGVVGHSSFEDCSIAERDANMGVHFHGHWNVTKAAWPHMKRQGYGRIVNVVSGVGFIGGENRIAYASAKAALIGFTRTLALEGEEHGILANGLGPAGFTRHTASSIWHFGKNLFDGSRDGAQAWLERYFDPRHSSVGVFLLAHETCRETGKFYNCQGGRMSRTIIAECDGFVTTDEAFTPENVLAHWAAVEQIEPNKILRNPAEAMERLMELVTANEARIYQRPES